MLSLSFGLAGLGRYLGLVQRVKTGHLSPTPVPLVSRRSYLFQVQEYDVVRDQASALREQCVLELGELRANPQATMQAIELLCNKIHAALQQLQEARQRALNARDQSIESLKTRLQEVVDIKVRNL